MNVIAMNKRQPANRDLRRVIATAELLAELMESLGLDEDLAIGASCKRAVAMFDEALFDFQNRGEAIKEAA